MNTVCCQIAIIVNVQNDEVQIRFVRAVLKAQWELAQKKKGRDHFVKAKKAPSSVAILAVQLPAKYAEELGEKFFTGKLPVLAGVSVVTISFEDNPDMTWPTFAPTKSPTTAKPTLAPTSLPPTRVPTTASKLLGFFLLLQPPSAAT